LSHSPERYPKLARGVNRLWLANYGFPATSVASNGFPFPPAASTIEVADDFSSKPIASMSQP
jgi:hypothetical protein